MGRQRDNPEELFTPAPGAAIVPLGSGYSSRQTKGEPIGLPRFDWRPVAQLPLPAPGRQAAEHFVTTHFRSLTDGEIEGSTRFTGGATAAKQALDRFDVTGFAARMDEVTPQPKRAASGLSPYLRHGLLTQTEAWNHVEGGPTEDVEKFREQLLWQEYARHWYSRLGTMSRMGTKRELGPFVNPTMGTLSAERRLAELHPGEQPSQQSSSLLPPGLAMACLEMTEEELEEDGWLVGRARSWLASYWAANGGNWREGEDHFFRHLLDGSRGANRLGWQTATGLTGGKPFLMNRWQVEKWAAGLCASCDLVRDCPLESPEPISNYVETVTPIEARVAADLLLSAGPPATERVGDPHVVWITAESLGPSDPAMRANPDLRVVFVFDQPLLSRLRLSPKRLVFLVETLAELAQERYLEVWLGNPTNLLANQNVAVTYAPVPGFRRRAAKIWPTELHPWPWLIEPTTGDLATFRQWRRSVGASLSVLK